ncbi:DASS family sodium-coupled anion symporter [Zhihengliuella alba]|uniref:Sodium-dependent dicarboxylate transporter SdcS n=1 Tax=Zhihengliuella alba TaxID=547018 RepID=A0ABP7D004_9MICC
MSSSYTPGERPRSVEDRARGSGHPSPGLLAEPVEPRTNKRRWIGLAAGLLAAFLVYFSMPQDLDPAARLTAATAVLMGIWWMTEALPIPATALVPLIVFPVFGGVDIEEVGSSYGNDIIFLFMGGFILALAMQRWNLHRRIALMTVSAMGTRSNMVIAGFMLATGFLSMWVSNTATTVMMLPIGVSVLMLVTNLGVTGNRGDQEPAPSPGDAGVPLPGSADEPAGEEAGGSGEDGETTRAADADVKEAVIASNFGTALMLGIAYAASVGSLSTIIGTPPNTLLVGYMKDAHGVDIGFGQWMLVGLPLAAVMLVLVWLLLTKVLFKPEIDEIPGGREPIRRQLRELGPMSTGEKLVLAMFALAALSWVFMPMIAKGLISDAGIAMTVSVLLFLLPAGARRGVRLLDWESAVKLPWGVLLLFGGGLALSAQFSASGLTEWIGEQAQALGTVPLVLLVLIMVAGVIFLTELTSNTATAATFLPVAGGVALGLGVDPLMLAVPVALAATCAFMLPVATPPNAIAYGSGYVTIGQMMRGGIWLNLAGIVLITVVTMSLLVWVFQPGG